MNKEDYKIAYENVMKANYLLDKEIERLNNIINELEKWLEERLDKLDINGFDDDIFNGLEFALNRLQELKEVIKSESIRRCNR